MALIFGRIASLISEIGTSFATLFVSFAKTEVNCEWKRRKKGILYRHAIRSSTEERVKKTFTKYNYAKS